MPYAATAAPSQIAASVPHNHEGRPHKGLSHDGIPVNGSQCVHHAQCVFPAILPGAPILPYLFGSSEFRVADILGGSENPLPQSPPPKRLGKSEEHTSELQSLMRISYAVFCLQKKTYTNIQHTHHH